MSKLARQVRSKTAFMVGIMQRYRREVPAGGMYRDRRGDGSSGGEGGGDGERVAINYCHYPMRSPVHADGESDLDRRGIREARPVPCTDTVTLQVASIPRAAIYKRKRNRGADASLRVSRGRARALAEKVSDKLNTFAGTSLSRAAG